ncbi:histidinol dehydrogenase [bacterium]
MSNILEKKVKAIINDVKKNGDKAVIKYTKKFDGISLSLNKMIVKKSELKKSFNKIPVSTRQMLLKAKDNISYYHKLQMKNIKTVSIKKKDLYIQEQVIPVQKAGVYIPGGRYSYPSSVLMNVLPAKAAGVKEIIAVTPKKNLTDEVKAALYISGVTKTLCAGGAQAIAGLAYGTKLIPQVHIIVGPGNRYVTEAKKQVFGIVGIDMLAGPSEVMIWADSSIKPEWLAEDLKAQAEHDSFAKAVLISQSGKCIKDVKKILKNKYKKQISYVLAKSINQCIDLINQNAPEHLELLCSTAQKSLPKITNAGAVFTGKWTPSAIGDYWFGPSHTLPTGKTARFSQGLSVHTFLKHRAVMQAKRPYLKKNKQNIVLFANIEGMKSHAESVIKRYH